MDTAEVSSEYLQPGFDPASFTVPKLRNILLEHNINYPSTAKKPQLIELFNQNIAPKAKRILAQRARTKPSSKGIVDVPSSQVSVADEEEEKTAEEPPAQKPKRTTRRTTRNTNEDSEATLLSSTAEPSRRTSSKHARSSDLESEDGPTSRRSRRTTATPTATVKEETQDPEAWHRHDDDSPFTQDNPFQSGSSPPTQAQRVSTQDKRRVTMGPLEHKEKRKSAAARRRTEFPKVEQQDDGIVVPTSSTFEVPVARFKTLKSEEVENGELVEAGEEFTPEEQQELALERAKHGNGNLAVARRKRPNKSSAGWWTLPTVLLAAIAGGFGFLWTEAKLDAGYCGVGSPVSAIGGWEVPEQLQFLLPQCEPCPQHAYCFGRLKTTCEDGFILQPHPLTAGGNIPLPLPPTCEPDTEKAKRIKTVADRAVEELRDRNAKFECGQLTDEHGKPAKSAAIDEETLRQTVSARKKKSMNQDEFDALWKEAIGEILGREEITSGTDGESGHRKLASTSLAKIPLACAIRRSIRQALVKYLWPIVMLLLFVATGGYTRYTIAYNRATEERARQLASYALDRLSTQAALHARDPSAYPEPFVSMAHLRDDVLRDEFSATRRIKLWVHVQKKVEANSNIRPMVREGRSGDRSRVWEWIGAVRALEDGPRRDSSRLSLGPIAGSSPPEMSIAKRGDQGGEMREARNWEDRRPVF